MLGTYAHESLTTPRSSLGLKGTWGWAGADLARNMGPVNPLPLRIIRSPCTPSWRCAARVLTTAPRRFSRVRQQSRRNVGRPSWHGAKHGL